MTAPQYPYLPPGRAFTYISEDNPYIQEAKAYAQAHSLDSAVKTGSVVVLNGEVVGRGANGSEYHKTNECERVRQNIPTGQGYDICEGCHPKNHSEPRAIADAKTRAEDLHEADLYLWGHWWACEPCWSAIQEAGIRNVYLLEGSDRLFNKEHPDNIL